jgi:superfamily II DNA/RNA helicase
MLNTTASPEPSKDPEKPIRPDSPTFAALGVRPETVAALADIGVTHAFAIQEYALPIALRGADLIGQAPTGTGKTFGFGLPLIDRVLTPAEGGDGTVQALVVLPTRELGLQVAKDLLAAGRTRGVRVLPVYGGVAYEPQVEALRNGVEIVVGTPGRLLDLAKQKHLRLDRVRALVLDEADRMLDLGFQDDVEKILALIPDERQTMLFSATMPDPIVTMARRFMRSPVSIHAGHAAHVGVSPQTRQVVYRTHPMNKIEIVARALQSDKRGLTMIFTRTKRAADRVAEDLDFRGFAVAAVHGDLGQGARERAMRAFRASKIDVLVATDVAARGLDVTGVTHVINYDCPEDADAYTHRIGRTGRAGATGIAVTFVDWEDMPRWRLIDKSLGLEMPEPLETYHTSPWLYIDLDIDPAVGGTLPSADRTRAGLQAEVLEDIDRKSRRPGGRDSREKAPRAPRNRTRRTGGSNGTGQATGDAPAADTAAGVDPASEPATGEMTRAPRNRRRGRSDQPTAERAAIADTTSSADATDASDGATPRGTAMALDGPSTGSDGIAVKPAARRRRRRPANATAAEPTE